MRKKELLGLILLVLGGGGIYLSVSNGPPQYLYLTAARDISPGQVVESQDFSLQSLHLAKASSHYVSGSAPVTGHRALRRISRGELVPRDALSSTTEVEQRRLLTFTVAKSDLPRGLKIGDLIDIYFFTIPTGSSVTEEIKLIDVRPRIRVQSIERDPNQVDSQVTISALFEASDSKDIMTLIATAKIALAQRFDDRE